MDDNNIELWEDLGALLPWVLGVIVVIEVLWVGGGRVIDIALRLMGWW